MEPIKIQTVIDHIEMNLTEELSYPTIAAMMAVSEADLQRSFKMITGFTISEYIRYRRLTEAAIELKNSGSKVLDVALNYGYQTAESFTKAFKQYHDCTPVEAKNTDQFIRYFHPIVIKLAKKGGNVTEYDASCLENMDSLMAYYDASDEHHRLTRNNHSRMEYLITMEYLNAVIPNNSIILDCCAGTGVYAFALAQNHHVVAGDLSKKHVNIMRQLQEKHAVLQGIHSLDVCNMGTFEDECFDAVLCMGALYHLFEYEKRVRAIRECMRVCKKNGILVFSYLNKWASFYNGFINNLKPLDLLYSEFDCGNHEDVFFRTTASEMDAMCQAAGLECLYNIGVDHLSFLASERVDTMNEEEFERLMSYQRKASSESNISGVSLHGLWIGRK